MAAPTGNQNAKGMKPNQTSFKKGEHRGLTTEFKKGMVGWNRGNPAPWTTKRNLENNPGKKGEENNMWKGGTSRGYKTGYYSTEYKKWRIAVFERDNYRCQGCTNVGGYLTAHHIKSFAHYPELRFVLENGITLCEDCHKLTDNYRGRGKKK